MKRGVQSGRRPASLLSLRLRTKPRLLDMLYCDLAKVAVRAHGKLQRFGFLTFDVIFSSARLILGKNSFLQEAASLLD